MNSKHKNYKDVSENSGSRKIEQNPDNLLKLGWRNSNPEKRYHSQKREAVPRDNVEELNPPHSQHYFESSPVKRKKVTDIICSEEITGSPVEENYIPIRAYRNLVIDDDDDGFYDCNTICEPFATLSLIPEMKSPIKPYEPHFLKEIIFPTTVRVKEKKNQKKNNVMALIREPADTFDFSEDFYMCDSLIKGHNLFQEFEDLYNINKLFHKQEEKDNLVKYGSSTFDALRDLLHHIELDAMQLCRFVYLFRQRSGSGISLAPVCDIDVTMRCYSVLQSYKTKSQKLFRLLVYGFFYYKYYKFKLIECLCGTSVALSFNRFF